MIMLHSQRNPIPDPSWTLEDWYNAATLNTYGKEKFMILADELWSPDRRSPLNLEKRFSGFNKDGITDRSYALAIIMALGACARKNGIRLMYGPVLQRHAALFLRKPICTADLKDLDSDEVLRITKAIANQVGEHADDGLPDDGDFDLLDRVFPPPPSQLIGRSLDLDHVLGALSASPIVVVDSNPGVGKTSLAWHAALHARDSGFVTRLDWNTDKRSMIDIDGEERPIVQNQQPLTYLSILRSMAVRFKWWDAMMIPDDRLTKLEETCRKHLRQELCLIVLDNIETVVGYEELLRRLAELIRPKRGALQLSHVLVTSRVMLPFEGCQRVQIKGLDEYGTDQYITVLEDRQRNNARAPLDAAQRAVLFEETQGNPLCVQIAVARYLDGIASFDTIIDQLRSGTGFYAMFKNLFGGLFDDLTREEVSMAVNAAFADPITYAKLKQNWLIEFSEDTEAAFIKALRTLIRLNILYPSGVGEETEGVFYTMHPLIRTYLRRYGAAH
jgi:hypothetical protein